MVGSLQHVPPCSPEIQSTYCEIRLDAHQKVCVRLAAEIFRVGHMKGSYAVL